MEIKDELTRRRFHCAEPGQRTEIEAYAQAAAGYWFRPDRISIPLVPRLNFSRRWPAAGETVPFVYAVFRTAIYRRDWRGRVYLEQLH